MLASAQASSSKGRARAGGGPGCTAAAHSSATSRGSVRGARQHHAIGAEGPAGRSRVSSDGVALGARPALLGQEHEAVGGQAPARALPVSRLSAVVVSESALPCRR